MFQDEIRDVVNLAEKKVSFLNKRPAAYFILSMLAGMYVGLGMVLIFTIGGLLNEAGFAGTRVVMGVSFGIALSLVTMAGAELFTGNNMVMIIGKYNEKVSWSNAVKLWILCWLGNLSGSLMTAFFVSPNRSCKGSDRLFHCQDVFKQDELVRQRAAGSRDPVQYSRMPCRMVLDQIKKRIRQIDHDFLVLIRLYHHRL